MKTKKKIYIYIYIYWREGEGSKARGMASLAPLFLPLKGNGLKLKFSTERNLGSAIELQGFSATKL